MKTTKLLFIATLAITAPVFVFAHGDEKEGFGHPGMMEDVDRTIEIHMTEMDFDPAELTFAPGETIRFVVINDGRLIHEFNIGLEAMHEEHEEEMLDMMRNGMMTVRSIDRDKLMSSGMGHDDPNALLLEPGKSGELIWTFDTGEEVMIACNVPGHRQSGMVGLAMPEGEHAD